MPCRCVGPCTRSTSVATACRSRPTWPAAGGTTITTPCSGSADTLLFALAEDSVDSILQAYPDIGRRPGSEKSAAEQCAIWCDQPGVMDQLAAASARYLKHFGFGFVMFVDGYTAQDVLATMTDRLLNDIDTERKVVRNELARINRTRLERMLGPEGGYDNW